MAEEERSCPECGATTTKDGKPFTPLSLGLHRKREHGVSGKTAGKRKKTSKRVVSGRDRAPSGPSSPRGPSVRKQVKDGMYGFSKMISASLLIAGDAHCSRVFDPKREPMSPLVDALADLAASDPRFARWLAWTGKAGPMAALGVVALDVALPVAAHHRLLPSELMLGGFEVVGDDGDRGGPVGGSLQDALVAAGRARHDPGPDGLGEDDTGAGAAL